MCQDRPAHPRCAPKSPGIATFERNLSRATSWLEPFDGFGPSNFLVGRPEFDFEVYRPWIDARFEPRRFSQLQSKMGNTVKYAVGAFIQALGQNPGLEPILTDLGPRAHVYVGTGLGDFPLHYEHALRYHRAQRSLSSAAGLQRVGRRGGTVVSPDGGLLVGHDLSGCFVRLGDSIGIADSGVNQSPWVPGTELLPREQRID